MKQESKSNRLALSDSSPLSSPHLPPSISCLPLQNSSFLGLYFFSQSPSLHLPPLSVSHFLTPLSRSLSPTAFCCPFLLSFILSSVFLSSLSSISIGFFVFLSHTVPYLFLFLCLPLLSLFLSVSHSFFLLSVELELVDSGQVCCDIISSLNQDGCTLIGGLV